ncbi:MAG TPA: hypothetical protein VFU81_20830, partial [Thermomicrobiales bacterium]|nr:hypothetical protein [Thermomicrobiales bacterium]
MSEPKRLNVLWLDPAPASEADFIRTMLPADTFAVAATPEASRPAVEDLRAADIIVTRAQPVTADVIAASPQLKLIQKYGGRPDRL